MKALAPTLFILTAASGTLLAGCADRPQKVMSNDPAQNLNPAMTDHQRAVRLKRSGGAAGNVNP